MNYGKEINAISQLLLSAALMQTVRKEVSLVIKEGFVVTDGKHHELGSDYDLVVGCGSKESQNVCRRLRGNVPDVKVERITDGVLGIKTACRMRSKK